MTQAPRIDWKIPLGLLLLSAIPVAAGVARLTDLADPAEVSTANARFLAAPVAVLVHIVSASLFSVVGALQFSAGLRLRYPRWHRVAGRITVAGGVLAALSGLWMTASYPIPPELQGNLLYTVRMAAGLAMLLSIARAVAAIRGRDIAAHQAWMMRAYALGQGAGMQAALLLPWMLLVGTPGMWLRDGLMSLAWLLNLLLAQKAIHSLAASPALP